MGSNKDNKASKPEGFGSTGTNFRASSKDLKQSSNKNIPYSSKP